MNSWPAALLRDVLEEHFDEACFLWRQRALAIGSRGLHRRDLSRIDERLLAHLDGLVIGGEPAWPLIGRGLDGPSPAAALVSAWIALTLDTDDFLDVLYPVLTNAPAPVFRGVCQAFRYARGRFVEECLPRWLYAAHFRVRAVAIDALSFHLRPIPEAIIAELQVDHAPAVRHAAVAAAGRYHLRALLPQVERLLDDADIEVRAAALTAAVLLGSADATLRCRELALRGGPEAAQAFVLLGRLGLREDRDQIFAPELAKAAPLPEAVSALAALGDPETLPWLPRLCGERRYAGLVTAVVQRVTGIDLISAGVSVQSKPAADPLAELDDIALAALPAADAEALAGFLGTHLRNLPPGRLCMGRPYGPAPLEALLREGPLGDHADAAFELARLGESPYIDPHPLFP